MPFLYNSISGGYTSSFMRDLNIMARPERIIPYSDESNKVASILNKELVASKISPRFFEMLVEHVSSTKTQVRVKIKNPLNPKEIAAFRVGLGIKKFSYYRSNNNYNRHTNITGTFLNPALHSSMWEKQVNEQHFLEPEEISKVFREFLAAAKIKFLEWDQIRASDKQSPALPFGTSDRELKKMATLATNVVVAHRMGGSSTHVGKSLPPSELVKVLSGSVPTVGISFGKILKELETNVYPNNLREDHPRFFDYIPAAPNPISVISNLLSAGINPFVGSWIEASGSTQLELQTTDWIKELVGFPSEGGGLFLNGGSEANMHGVRIAKKIFLGDDLLKLKDAVVYTSAQLNSSAYKGLQTLGFDIHNPNLFREIPVNNDFQISVDELESAIKADKQKGLLPFCVIANFGTTATGTIDPIAKISDVCKRENLWLHIDAAYGGGFITSTKFRSDFQTIGIHKADSLVINPHKAMFTPYGSSILLVRDARWLKQTYEGKQKSSFLDDYNDKEVNYYERSPHFTRNGRQALELWMALKHYGLNEFGRAIDRLDYLSHFVAQEINKDLRLELVTGPNLSVITFKYTADGLSDDAQNTLNTRIREEVNKTGFANIGKASLDSKTVLRMCLINPQTTEEDISKTLELIRKIGDKLIVKTGTS